PIRVKLSTRDVSSSLRYGLVQSQHSLLVSGDKGVGDQFLSRVRASLNQDAHDRMNTPRVLSVSPDSWLEASPLTSSPLGTIGTPNNSLGGLGLTGILAGAIAGLLLLSKARTKDSRVNGLQEASAHLEKRGFQNLELLEKS